MSGPDAAAVAAAIRAWDGAKVRELLASATDKERAALAKTLKPLLQRPLPALPGPGHGDGREARRKGTVIAAGIALASGHRSALQAMEQAWSFELTSGDYDVLAGILADRGPAWLPDLVDRMLTRRFDGNVESWPLARRLVRLGAIDRPDAGEYAVKMVSALTQAPPPVRRGETDTPQQRAEAFGSGGERLASVLLDDPGLLEDEVWRLFTLPGVGKAMEGCAYYSYVPRGVQWADAIAILAAQGQLDMGRLLDGCLDAFLSDFPPSHVAWYATLHDRLRPSVAAKAERAGRYLALLAAPAKPGVTVGQRGCAELLQAGLLDATAFLAASPPALIYLQKSVATAQLKIIGKLAARQLAVRDNALAAAAEAFGHQREDVQAAAVELIAKHGLPADSAARAAIIGQAALLSPVLQPDATALGLVPEAGNVPVAPVALVAPVAPVAPVGRVAPVTDPAELVQLLAQLVEDASDPLAVERALDGAVRLSALPLRDRARLAEPLLKRAREQAVSDFFGAFSGYWPRADMASLVLTWATGKMPRVRANLGYGLVGERRRHRALPKSMSGILSARGWEACGLIADGNGFPLLATPEFEDGSISHDELLARLARWPAPGGRLARLARWPAGGSAPRPTRTDVEVAMLRLAPGAESVLPDDLLAAYSPAQAPVSIEPYAFPRKVTEQPRPHLPGQLGGTWQRVDGYAGVSARYTSAGQVIHQDFSLCGQLVTQLRPEPHFGRRVVADEGLRTSELVAAWPLLAPHQPELITAHLLSALSEGLVPGRSAASTAVRAVARLGGSFGLVGHVALVAGLSSAEPDARIAAADAWAQLARQGRLDPGLAGDAIVLGVTGTAFKLARIADGLRYVLQDPGAAGTVSRACVPAAASLLSGPDRPTSLHLLLEVAAQAAAVAGVPQLPAPLADLAVGKGRTKLAEAARRLAALNDRQPGQPSMAADDGCDQGQDGAEAVQ